MFHFQKRDRVRDDGLRVQVRRGQDVGDVAVDEDVARLEAEDGGFGDAGVGAADPEDLGGLALGEGGEEVGFGLGEGLGPFFVLLQGEFEGVCGGGSGLAGLYCAAWWEGALGVRLVPGGEFRAGVFLRARMGEWEKDRVERKE